MSRRSLVIPTTLAVLAVAVAVPAAAGDEPIAAPAGEELAALAVPAPRSALATERIYFVMTDRFANGRPRTTAAASPGPRG